MARRLLACLPALCAADEQSSDSDSDGFGHDPEGFRQGRAAEAWSDGSDSDGDKHSRPFY